MKKVKRFIMLGAIVTVLGAVSVTAYATSSYSTPAEVTAGVTGRTVEEVTAERYETGKTYGTIADEAGKLEEFQTEMVQIKKNILEDRVEAGLMTQENAGAIITAIEENQSTCDGTGNMIGKRMGAGFGGMNGKGQGNGQGMRVQGQCSGTCQVQ
ncbi:DUF2680 domain-containing protein [Aminipila sp.]|uniref:DUF2680 domain-containing protein n=1 Tax=Aminipila sp. TaxID=2060095 RepID=UPI0028A160FA|nr:DUF2680 domain-containing protein [Aminipila sp.]